MNQDYQNLYQSGMSNQNQNTAPQTLTKAAPNQPNHAFYSYCRVKINPWLVPFAVVVTVLTGLIITLLVLTAGVSLLRAVFIGGFFSAVFAFLFWYAKRVQTGSAKRLKSYLAADGGQGLFSDFASAQPFANDQFRVGRQYLFIKNGAVLRLDSITDIVRINHHYHFVPTGVSLTLTEEEKAVIIQTAQELANMNTVFYSGHCTGIPAFEMMKVIMGDKLIALHSGETVI